MAALVHIVFARAAYRAWLGFDGPAISAVEPGSNIWLALAIVNAIGVGTRVQVAGVDSGEGIRECSGVRES